MRLQLIKIAEQENQPLFKGLYSMANEARVGIIREGKILFKTEEYLFLIKQLTEPRGGTQKERLIWETNFHNYAIAVRLEFDAIFVYP